MAKSKETFNKKEKEKKRLKQKQDKNQKMEDRKANKKKGNSLEDMMAYLDENGNLTNTPSDPRVKRVFKQEDIEIGIPKREEIDEADLIRTGKVTFYNTAKGFGFINDLTSNERIFFHVNDTLEPLQESDKVEYQISHGPRGLSASQVKKMN